MFPEGLGNKVVIVNLVVSKLEKAPKSALRSGRSLISAWLINLSPQADKLQLQFPEVQKVGRVEADLSGVPGSAFKTEERDFRRWGGRKILHAALSIEMSVASADLKFEIMFEGASYGKTRIEYHHDGLSNTSMT